MFFLFPGEIKKGVKIFIPYLELILYKKSFHACISLKPKKYINCTLHACTALNEM